MRDLTAGLDPILKWLYAEAMTTQKRAKETPDEETQKIIKEDIERATGRIKEAVKKVIEDAYKEPNMPFIAPTSAKVKKAYLFGKKEFRICLLKALGVSDAEAATDNQSG